MTPRLRLVQLFNACAAPAGAPQPDPDSAPNHRLSESVLSEVGFEVETVPAYGRPWNPAARMHNAYLGLDPMRALRILLGRRRASVVCGHLESVLVVLLLRRYFGFRPPVVIWELPWSPGWAFRETISRLAVPRADCCVVFGSNQIAAVRQIHGDAVKLAVVPFCVDTGFFRPMPRVDEVAPYVFSTGLDAGRDFDVVLRAARDLPIPVVLKVWKGFRPAEPPGAAVTVVDERVSYPRYRALYAGASIVVVATHATVNASGVTSLLEAMAMGKPVVVTDNPALRDYLPPPEAGIVVPVAAAAAIRAALEGLLTDPARAAAMGQAARAFVETRFGPRSHFLAMADMLRRVAGGPATG